MRKLSLDLDDRSVESFTTENDGAGRGTVVGHDETTGPYIVCSCNPVGGSWASCQPSCEATCQASCNETCEASCDCPTYDYRCGDTNPGQLVCVA